MGPVGAVTVAFVIAPGPWPRFIDTMLANADEASSNTELRLPGPLYQRGRYPLDNSPHRPDALAAR